MTVDEKEELHSEYTQLLEQSRSLEEQINQLRSKGDALRKAAPGVYDYIWPTIKFKDGSVSYPSPHRNLPNFTQSETRAIYEYGKLSVEINDKEQLLLNVKDQLAGLNIQAITEGIKLSEEKAEAKVLKRRGPKGPRKSTIPRRSFIKLLNSQGIKGREACERLTALDIDLPSPKLRETYENSWVMWFDTDPQGFYRQWSADLTRA